MLSLNEAMRNEEKDIVREFIKKVSILYKYQKECYKKVVYTISFTHYYTKYTNNITYTSNLRQLHKLFCQFKNTTIEIEKNMMKHKQK